MLLNLYKQNISFVMTENHVSMKELLKFFIKDMNYVFYVLSIYSFSKNNFINISKELKLNKKTKEYYVFIILLFLKFYL